MKISIEFDGKVVANELFELFVGVTKSFGGIFVETMIKGLAQMNLPPEKKEELKEQVEKLRKTLETGDEPPPNVNSTGFAGYDKT